MSVTHAPSYFARTVFYQGRDHLAVIKRTPWITKGFFPYDERFLMLTLHDGSESTELGSESRLSHIHGIARVRERRNSTHDSQASVGANDKFSL